MASKDKERDDRDEEERDEDEAPKDDEGSDDEPAEEEEKPKKAEPKPAPKAAAKPASKAEAKPAAKAQAKPGAKKQPYAPPKEQAQGGGIGKSLILFVIVFGGLAAAFAFLGREDSSGPAKPKWTVGQTIDVELTLVKDDAKNLSCASSEEIGGKHCAFESQQKTWSKGSTDDKSTYKPYTTTDRIQFVAAGVWSEPALAPDKLPPSRFAAKCKLKIDGKFSKLDVRWDQTGAWYPNADWFAGSVSSCVLVQ